MVQPVQVASIIISSRGVASRTITPLIRYPFLAEEMTTSQVNVDLEGNSLTHYNASFKPLQGTIRTSTREAARKFTV